MLVEGKWVADWQPVQAKDEKGGFVRQTSSFRNWVTPDGSAGPTGEGGFEAEADRYHLYVALICPWASRTLIGRRRSISVRVNTVLAALLLLRSSTSRLAVIRVSDSFSASSWEAGCARARLGARAMARAIRDSFILDPQKVGKTFEEGR